LVNLIAFLPNLKLIAFRLDDETVKIWDVVTGIYTQTLKGYSYLVNLVTFLPNLKLVASGSRDKTVKIWDIVTGVYM